MYRLKKYTKSSFKIAHRLVLASTWGLALLVLLLLQHDVQLMLAKKGVKYIAQTYKTNISIEDFYLNPFGNIKIKGLIINDLKNDTLTYVGFLSANLFDINLRQYTLSMDTLLLENAHINLNKTNQIYNFDFLIPKIKNNSKTNDNWHITANQIRFENLRLYHNDSQQPYKKDFDPNHLKLKKLSGLFKNIDIRPLTNRYLAEIGYLSLVEKQFVLKNLKGSFEVDSTKIIAQNLLIETSKSKIRSSIELLYGSFLAFDDFENQVLISTTFNASVIDQSDIDYFFNRIIVGKPLVFSGNIKGKVNQFVARNLFLGVDTSSYFMAQNLNVKNIATPNQSLIVGTNVKLKTSKTHLQNLVPYMEFPPNTQINLDALGQLVFEGNIESQYIKKFKLKGKIRTQIGNIETDILAHIAAAKSQYKGYIKTNNFDIGTLLNQGKRINQLTFEGKIDAMGNTLENLVADIDAKVQSATLNDYLYKNLAVVGKINAKLFVGQLNSDDENVRFDFNGMVNMRQETPIYSFQSNVIKIDFGKLKLIEGYNGTLEGKIDCDFRGKDIANLHGKMNVSDFIYQEQNRFLDLKYLELIADSNSFISLNSDILDATISGEYNLKTLPNDVESFLSKYLPSIVPKKESKSYHKVVFDADLKEGQRLADFFFLNQYKVENIALDGVFDNRYGQLNIDVFSPSFSYQNKTLDSINLKGFATSQDLVWTAKVATIKVDDSIVVNKFDVLAKIYNDKVEFLSLVGIEKAENNANSRLAALIDLKANKLEFLPNSTLDLDGNVWEISPYAAIGFNEKDKISIDGFKISQQNQFLRLNGTISKQQTDTLTVWARNFDLSQFNPILKNFDSELGGTLDVYAKTNNVLDNPMVFGQLDIKKFVFDEEPIGDIEAHIDYDSKAKRAETILTILDGFKPRASVAGFFQIKNNKPFMDFDISLDQQTIKPIEKLLEPTLTDIQGLATGGLRLYGTLDKLSLTGFANLEKGQIKIDFLGQTYYLNKTQIDFTDQYIDFNQTQLADKQGGTATLSGKIKHNYFQNTSLDLKIDANKLLVINNQNPTLNELYYGTAVASGYATLKGMVNDIYIYVAATTQNGTDIKLPLTSPELYEQNKFITFVSEETKTNKDKNLTNEAKVDISFDLDLYVTPNAKVDLIFDRVAGDIIRGTGSGLIKMNVDKQGNFSMLGKYNITQGNYLFSFQNTFGREFEIKEGGSITWTGDPYDAQINLDAVYKTRSTLQNLLPSIADESLKNYRFPIDCILKMNGSMLSPAIDFAIDIPTLTNNTAASNYATLIASQLRDINNNPQRLNEQVFGLLMFGQFIQSENLLSVGSVGDVARSTVSEFVASQINNVLSQYTGNLNIGVNYRNTSNNTSAATNIINPNDLQVMLSTTLFNDRIVLDANGGSVALNNTNRTFGGDISVEYKITQDGRFRAKMYNKLDDRSAFSNATLYRQGVGISYRKEFNTFREHLNIKKIQDKIPTFQRKIIKK